MLPPLPKRQGDDPDFNTGNRGLIFNKFFDQWPPGFAEVKGPEKSRWLNQQIKSKLVSEPPDHSQFYKDIKATPIDFILIEPLVCGMGYEHPVENGFFFHHTTGLPVIPGSSLKGVLRHWLEIWKDQKPLADRLCGAPDRVGSVIFFDMFPTTPPELTIDIVTPHIGSWRLDGSNPPADWISPVPIPFLTIKPGATFRLAIAPRRGSDQADVDMAHTHLAEALAELGIGARTSRGMGRMERSLKLAVGNYVQVVETPQVNNKIKGKIGCLRDHNPDQDLWGVAVFNPVTSLFGSYEFTTSEFLKPIPKPDGAP